jgi:hypothetical protein
VCPRGPFARTRAHCFSFGATAWRVAEPMAKSPREMGVVAKAADVRDLAESWTNADVPPIVAASLYVVQVMVQV